MNPSNTSTPQSRIVPILHKRKGISRVDKTLSPIPQIQDMDRPPSEPAVEIKDNYTGANISEDEVDEKEGSLSDSHTSDNSDQSDDENVNKGEHVNNITTPASAQLLNESRTINKNSFNMIKLYTVLPVIIVVLISIVYAYIPNNSTNLTLNDLKAKFPEQDDKLWIYIESGVSEIQKFNKPSVIILLYKKKLSYTTNELLNSITIYASCILNGNCSADAIFLESDDLNTNEMKNDYGVVIDRFKPLLEEKHVMVVKNIDEVTGNVAQAFHYFCDEFIPLVKKALLIFTIEVDAYRGRELQQVEDILQKKWSDIDHDKLEPLITRVSSIVLRIK